MVLVVVLYLLPKVVVDNEQEQNAGAIGDSSSPDLVDSHDRQLTENEQAAVSGLKDGFNAELNPEKSATFADSLAGLFSDLNYLDSAAYYYGVSADKEPSMERWLKAGEAYFEAYSYAVELDRQHHFGQSARKYFNLALGKRCGIVRCTGQNRVDVFTRSTHASGVTAPGGSRK